MIPLTKNGHKFFEATSAFQKAIRRGDEPVAIYFAVEFFNSGLEKYLWKRMKVILSEDIGLAEPDLPATIAALQATYEERKKEPDEKHNKPERMFLIHAVLLLVRAKKSRLVDYVLLSAWREHDVKIEVPDYAYDKHTQKGKAMGRGIDHFWQEGAKINNAVILPGEQEWKKKAIELMEKHPGLITFDTIKSGNRNHQEALFNEDNGEQE